MRIGITVFGTPSYFDVDVAVSEFKNFVQANSKLDFEVIMNKYPALALSEYHTIPGAGGCTFIDPKYLRPETLAKFPSDATVQIAIYDIQNTTSCYGGRAYPQSPQMKNAPFIGIPFGGAISRWGTEPNWKTRTATALVHEFYHAFSFILSRKRYRLPDADKANSYGYTTENDPGWVRFDKFIYGQITDEMYLSLTQ
jgi:hypothetical protein